MRHRKAGRRLNRTSAHRKAMFANMATSLFRHEMIKTTLPKAKELRRVAEPLITLAKTASVANRRAAFAALRDRAIVCKLFDELGPHFAERPGGYLRVLKCGHRGGDNAPMAYVQLVGRDLSRMKKSADEDEPQTDGKTQDKVKRKTDANSATDADSKIKTESKPQKESAAKTNTPPEATTQAKAKE